MLHHSSHLFPPVASRYFFKMAAYTLWAVCTHPFNHFLISWEPLSSMSGSPQGLLVSTTSAAVTKSLVSAVHGGKGRQFEGVSSFFKSPTRTGNFSLSLIPNPNPAP